MSFKQKIDMILEAKALERLSINKIEKLIGVDGTIYKAHKDDRYPADSEIVRNIIGKLNIRPEWWDREWETGSKDIFLTSVQNGTDNTEKSSNQILSETIDKLAKDAGEYFLVPKTVFEGNYRFVPIQEYEIRERELARKDAELIRKDSQIQGLYELFKLVLAGRTIDIQSLQEGKEKTDV